MVKGSIAAIATSVPVSDGTGCKILKIWPIGILVFLAGCGAMGAGDRSIDYRATAVQGPALDMPPDLSASSDRYQEPDGESVSTFSDYSKGGAVASRKTDTVLPEIKGVNLVRNGAQRWLVIDDKPENVLAVVRAFLQENGLPIKSEDPPARIIETDWVESRASIPQGGVRKLVGKVFDNPYSSGERDQYRVRLEPRKDAVEVHITHRGMKEVADGSTSKWQMRANDPEMEAIMLQRLMARFGGETQAAAPAGLAATDALPGSQNAVSVQEISDGSRIIVLNDAYDRSWRRVGLAIERAGLLVEDKDRAKGVYFLRPAKAKDGWLDKLSFWKDSADLRYRLNVRDNGVACEVSVTDQNGASDQTSMLMIEALYKNIVQNETGALAKTAPPAKVQAPGAKQVSDPVPAKTANLQELLDGSNVIVVNDQFDNSWRRIGLAIERAGLTVESSDSTGGSYLLRPNHAESGWPDKLMFWKDSGNNYRVSVKDGGKACVVFVSDQNGAYDDKARKLVMAIYKNIE